MNLVGFAVDKPVTVLVGVILLVLFGMIAVLTLPIQLTPDVDQPRITVTTPWEGASPQEVEREIVDEQEERLRSVPGLRRMTSIAVEGLSTVEIEFFIGTDVSRSLLEVSDRLRQVPEYPDNVDQPVVTAGETEGTNAIAWMILRRSADSAITAEQLPLLRTLMEDVVKPRLERTPGIAGVGIVGGVEREIHVRVDPHALAGRGLSLMDVRDAIRARNVDVSAGTAEGGRRAFTIRTVGRFESLDEMRELVVVRRNGTPVTLGEVAEVRDGFKKPVTIVRSFGQPSIAINATRQSGSNVIEVMDGLKAAIADINAEVLEPRGLELFQVYDQTGYIYSAIDLVTQNLWVGGILAVLVLLLFLRSGRSTLIVAVAIPISVIGSFLALTLLGRNLNVVSLAGLAFAVGMVVDNSIVVLESIYRHAQSGKPVRRAAIEGTQEVWGAVVASTLTTMAVFVPVVFVQEEAGQLFRDIAIAISAAVLLSLVVSVIFIPMAAARLLKVSEGPRRAPRRFGPAAVGGAIGGSIASVVAWLTARWWRRLATVGGITAAAVLIAMALAPPMAYLPQGNQNLVIGFVIPPPGYSTDTYEDLGRHVEKTLAPYWGVERGEDLADEFRRPDWYTGESPMPALSNFFFVAFGQSVFMGAKSDDAGNVAPLVDLMQRAAGGVPDTMAFAMQRSLFERGLSSSNSVDIEITGEDVDALQQVAGMLFGAVMQKMGPPRPEPANFNLGAPEIRITPDQHRARELGLNVRDVGFIVRTMVDGSIVSDYRSEGATLDVKLVPMMEKEHVRSELGRLPVHTPNGGIVSLASMASLVETTAPNEIRHIEEKRAIKLVVTPPADMELSTAMAVLENEILAPMRASGAIPSHVSARLGGSADKLAATRDALQWNLILALVLTYLLLAALFESFIHPLVILFSVPLAAVGGVAGLWLVHGSTGQQMDILTMLGFVILIGTVVNNAILIVHGALARIRDDGADPSDAVVDAVRTRVRPIFMSTLTSVLGMAPLVVFPGAGSELYRGLGSVVIGGLLASTVFTLLVVPTLFRIVTRRKRKPAPVAD